MHWIGRFAITQDIIKVSPLKFSIISLILRLVLLVFYSTVILQLNCKIRQKRKTCQLTVCDDHSTNNEFSKTVGIVCTF